MTVLTFSSLTPQQINMINVYDIAKVAKIMEMAYSSILCVKIWETPNCLKCTLITDRLTLNLRGKIHINKSSICKIFMA